MVTCEIKLVWNSIEIISVFYFTCNHRSCLRQAYYFKIISALMSMSEISLWNNFEITSGKFPRAEIKLFQTDVDKSWNNFEIILFRMWPGHWSVKRLQWILVPYFIKRGYDPLISPVSNRLTPCRRSDPSPELSAWRVTNGCVASWGMLGEPAAAAAEVYR